MNHGHFLRPVQREHIRKGSPLLSVTQVAGREGSYRITYLGPLGNPVPLLKERRGRSEALGRSSGQPSLFLSLSLF